MYKHCGIGIVILLATALAACQPTQESDREAATEEASVPEQAEPAPTAARDPLRPDLPGLPDAGLAERDTTPVDVDVVGVRLSNRGDAEENSIGGQVATFQPNDTVYAEIETSGTAPGYTIYAKWLAPDGTVLSDYGMRVNEAGPKRTVISLSKPDGWARGQGKIEIAINGELEETATFDVP